MLRVSYIDGKYSVSRSEGPSGSAVPAVQAKRQGRLARAVAHGWNPDLEVESQARRLVAALLDGRDDIGSLPLSAAAKAYARRRGLRSMQRQPFEFMRVNAEITNPGKEDIFKNYEVGANTDGSQRAPKSAIKDALERGRVEQTTIRRGKTRGKFHFPANWAVKHAIKK